MNKEQAIDEILKNTRGRYNAVGRVLPYIVIFANEEHGYGIDDFIQYKQKAAFGLTEETFDFDYFKSYFKSTKDLSESYTIKNRVSGKDAIIVYILSPILGG